MEHIAHYRVYESLPLAPILSQMNSVQDFPFYLFSIHFLYFYQLLGLHSGLFLGRPQSQYGSLGKKITLAGIENPIGPSHYRMDHPVSVDSNMRANLIIYVITKYY